jgi:hypothetical protein
MPFPATERWIPLGPCQVQIGTVTIDRVNNVRFRDTSLTEDILYDEEGAAAADRMDVGADVMVEFDIARETWENLATILDELRSVGSAPNELIERISQVGSLDSASAQVMKIKQYVNGQPDSTGYKTLTLRSVKLRLAMDAGFAARGQRFVHVTGRGYMDQNGVFWHLGTPA